MLHNWILPFYSVEESGFQKIRIFCSMWNLPVNSVWIFVTVTKHKILNKVKEGPRRLWGRADRIWHFKTQILPVFSCKLSCLLCSVSQWHRVTSHTPHPVQFKEQRKTELLEYHLQREVNKFPEGLQISFFRQESLPHSPILYNRDNHTDQLCRALWELLVRELQNWWLLRGLTSPADILGHIFELSMEFLMSLCTESRNTLCTEKSTDNLKRNFERSKILKANKWECSEKQDSEPAVGKGWRGSGQPRCEAKLLVWLCPGKRWANISVHERNRK